MNRVSLFYDDGFEGLDFGPGHPMRGDRYSRAMSEFKGRGLLDRLSILKPDIISDDILTLFHTPGYVDLVKRVGVTGRGIPGSEVPGFKGVYDVARLSVSATVSGAAFLMDDGSDIAVNICGGWHHAFENQGRGFCIFNDIAVAANFLLEKKGMRKIMILDYDAHHGDGTQKAFYENPDVYTISYHQDPRTLYPFLTGYEEETGSGRGEGFNRNFPLSPYCGDEEFIDRFNEFPGIAKSFKPEVLILQMGVDGSRECTISTMQLTQKGYDYASQKIIELKKELGFKILALGGGGFVHPMLGRNWGIQIKNFIKGNI